MKTLSVEKDGKLIACVFKDGDDYKTFVDKDYTLKIELDNSSKELVEKLKNKVSSIEEVNYIKNNCY